MRILIIGATGNIGNAVRNELASRHEIISAGRSGADIFADITSLESITTMYQTVGKVAAVISTAGNVYFGSIRKMTPVS